MHGRRQNWQHAEQRLLVYEIAAAWTLSLALAGLVGSAGVLVIGVGIGISQILWGLISTPEAITQARHRPQLQGQRSHSWEAALLLRLLCASPLAICVWAIDESVVARICSTLCTVDLLRVLHQAVISRVLTSPCNSKFSVLLFCIVRLVGASTGTAAHASGWTTSNTLPPLLWTTSLPLTSRSCDCQGLGAQQDLT